MWRARAGASRQQEVVMSKHLYRDPQRGALGGVCAGLADYLGVEIWVVRLVAVTALILSSATVTSVAKVLPSFVTT